MKYNEIERLLRLYPNLPITKITEIYIENNPDELKENKIDTIRRRIQFYKEYLEERKKEKTSPESLVLLISDAHFGRVTWDFENKVDFCLKEAKRRLEVVKNGVLKLANLLSNSYEFKDLWLLFLGDEIDGELTFPAQQMHVEVPELKQVAEAVYSFEEFIDDLKERFPKVYLRGVYGNHAGDRRKHEVNKGDMYLYKFLEQKYQNDPKVDAKFSEQFYDIVEINKHGFLLYHGMGIRSYMGIPFYGIRRWGANRLKTLPKDWEYMLIGHFHTLGHFHFAGFEVYMNGTFVTSDPYSLEHYGRDGDPKWWFFSVHEERGITFQYKIDVRG